MVEPVAVLTIGIAALASAVMAWVIGAGSSGATPFAPAVGANAISIMRAALVVGLLGFLGAALQGGNVTTAVGSGLVDGPPVPASGAIIALSIGAGLMIVGIATGYPIATAFTVTGAVVGVGLAAGGDPAWDKYGQIATVWLLTPPIGGGVAYGIASVLPRDDVPETVSVPVLAGFVGAILANLELTLLGPPGGSAALSTVVATQVPIASLPAHVGVTILVGGLLATLVQREVRHDLDRGLKRFLLAVGGLVAFSAGGSQVGLAVGPLLPVLSDFTVPLSLVLVGGGVGMLVGSWTGAPRMIKAVSQDYASLGPRRSIAALVPSFVVAQVAILLGVPISFNEIVVSAIVGSGVAVGGMAGASTAKLSVTALAWVGSLAGSLVLGYVAFATITAI
jgi:PiT family inorganic phosphate transporter